MSVIVISGKDRMQNARERFDAFTKGEPVPPKTGERKHLTPEEAEPFLDALAKIFVREYTKAEWRDMDG